MRFCSSGFAARRKALQLSFCNLRIGDDLVFTKSLKAATPFGRRQLLAGRPRNTGTSADSISGSARRTRSGKSLRQIVGQHTVAEVVQPRLAKTAEIIIYG